MFEHRSKPLVPRKEFVQRILRNFLYASFMLIFSLLIGIIGYHEICGLGWVDALLNSSMILTGMGPVNVMTTNGAKIFASIYAIFSGVAFLTTVGVLLAPIVHRLMHKFHLQDEED